MKTTIMYEDREDLKTKIILCECEKLKYIHIYQFDDDGFVDNDMRIFNPETVESLKAVFTEHPDTTFYDSNDFEPIAHLAMGSDW